MTSTEAATLTTTQVYRIYIRATPEAIWDAITNPDWNEKYGYPGRGEFDLRPGGKYLATADEQAQAMGMPAELVDGEVIEVDPPRKLVQTWHALWPELVDEKPTRVTWEIEDEVEGHLAPHGDPRARGCAEARGAGRQRDPAHPGRRRLGVDPERSQDAARDRRRPPPAKWR